MVNNAQKILVVDDEAVIRELLRRNLSDAGYEVTTASDGMGAIESVSRDEPHVVLLDMRMPGISGIEVLKKLAGGWPDLCEIMVTAIDDTKTAVQAMKLGAFDYITKPFDIDKVILSIDHALEKRRLVLENRDYQQHLEQKVGEQTRRIQNSFLNALQSLAYALEAKDRYTNGHSQRVANLAVAIAERMGLSEREIEVIHQAGLVHDIGKIGVREAVLNKPSGLSEEEFRHIQLHPEIGERILIPVTEDKEILEAIRHHHERFDGKGYPDKISRHEISIQARILSVADAYDAMTSERPYRAALSDASARAELAKCRNSQFDPEVLDAFLNERI
jgi:putative two-component system response regulator